MKIVVCCKIVPDEELIKVLPNRELSFAEVPVKISQYDLNALEEGKRLATETQGTLLALSLGSNEVLESSKIRKDVLSRGVDELYLVVDDAHTYADSLESAKALATALKEIGEYDLVLCGVGSGDLYAQQVGNQLGTLLDLPTVNNVTAIKQSGALLEIERTLESAVETLEVAMPAVVSVSSEINIPAVPSMRDIMRAGKKPINELSPDLSAVKPSLEIVEQLAPQQQERRMQIVEGDGEEAVNQLVQFLKKEIL